MCAKYNNKNKRQQNENENKPKINKSQKVVFSIIMQIIAHTSTHANFTSIHLHTNVHTKNEHTNLHMYITHAVGTFVGMTCDLLLYLRNCNHNKMQN